MLLQTFYVLVDFLVVYTSFVRAQALKVTCRVLLDGDSLTSRFEYKSFHIIHALLGMSAVGCLTLKFSRAVLASKHDELDVTDGEMMVLEEKEVNYIILAVIYHDTQIQTPIKFQL